MEQFGSTQEFSLAGQACLRLGQPPIPGWSAFTPDDRTLVLASADTLRDLIQDRRAPAPRRAWDQIWEKSVEAHSSSPHSTHAGCAAGSGPDAAAEFGTKLDTIAPLLEKARAYVISVDTKAGIDVNVRALTSGADDAKPVAETMQALTTLARNSVEGIIQESAGKPEGEAMRSTVVAAGSLLSQAKIETSENVVHLQAKSALQLSELVKSLSPVLSSARLAAGRAQSINNLKQIGLAFHNYAQVNNHLPPPALLGGDQKKFPYSWRVALLPYLDQDALYREYRFDEPWDGPNNSKLIDQMPAVYSVPGPGGAPLSRSKASYYVFTGQATLLGSPWVPGGQNPEPTRFEQVIDGTSNTILAVEWDGNVPWTKPDDIPFDPNGAVPVLGGFWSDEVNVLLGDGSVRGMRKEIFPNILKALVTRAGKEVIQGDAFAPVQTRSRPPKQ